MRWLDAIIGSMDMSLDKLLEIVKDRESWHTAVHGITELDMNNNNNNNNKANIQFKQGHQHVLSVYCNSVFCDFP